MNGRPIYIVLAAGVILGAYTRRDSAELHARIITGAVVVQVDLFEAVPDSVREDIASDEWDGDDTPVIDEPDAKR